MTSPLFTPAFTVAPVILSSPADWDEWIEMIKSRAIIGNVWKYINPDTPRDQLPTPLQAPIRPALVNVNPNKPKYSDLSEDEEEDVEYLRELYKRDRERFEEQESALKALPIHIQKVVSRNYLFYTFKCETAYDMLVSLKRVAGPIDDTTTLLPATQYAKKSESTIQYERGRRLAAQYERLRKPPRSQNYEAWLQRWEKVYTECKAANLPEVHGDRPLTDFLYAVNSVDPIWAAYWICQLEITEWKKKPLPSFFELINMYRRHLRTEAARKEEAQSASAGSSQGDPIDKTSKTTTATPSSKSGRKKRVPKCYCGAVHWFRDCPYIVESARSNGWKPDEAVAKDVERKIAKASERIKKQIEKLRQKPQ